MDSDKYIRSLRIPLYKLYYIDDIDQFNGLKESEINQLSEEYTSDEIDAIRGALKWGESHPEYDFKSLLPDIGFSNKSIHKYICVLSDQLSMLG